MRTDSPETRKTRDQRQGHRRHRALAGRKNASDVRLLGWGEGDFARSGARGPPVVDARLAGGVAQAGRVGPADRALRTVWKDGEAQRA